MNRLELYKLPKDILIKIITEMGIIINLYIINRFKPVSLIKLFEVLNIRNVEDK